MNIKTLKHGDGVKVIVKGMMRYCTVGTIAGYATERGDNVEEAIARAVKNGHSTDPWINQDCGVTTNDRAYNSRRVTEMMARPEVKDGEVVLIDGAIGTIKIRGNFSDLGYIKV